MTGAVDAQVDASNLILHIKLYIFGDRFNIVALKDLTYTKSVAILRELRLHGEGADQDHILTFLKGLRLASEHLPSTNDKLMVFLVEILAWAFKQIRVHPEFTELLLAQPEVGVALCMNLDVGSGVSPWLGMDSDPPLLRFRRYTGKDQDTTGQGMRAMRRCSASGWGCQFLGFPLLQCLDCKFTWQDARTGFGRSTWVPSNCRGCGRADTPISPSECCPLCGDVEVVSGDVKVVSIDEVYSW